jgi:hypothetical protein
VQYTTNLGLKLPETTDKFDIDDLNENFQKIDAAYSSRGGGAAVGLPVSIAGGLSSSVIGVIEEVTE